MAYNAETKRFAVHPALGERLEASKAAAAAVQSDTEAPPEKPDVDMTVQILDGNDSYVVVISEGAIKPAPVVTPKAIVEVSRSTMVNGPEVLYPEYTAYVNLVSERVRPG